MSCTLYDGTVPVILGLLSTLTHILQKAEKHANAEGLLQARLREDMFPLTDQVRLVTQFSEFLAARLQGREPTTFPKDDLTSFAKFYERIETVRKALLETDKDEANRRGDVVEPTNLGPEGTKDMSGAIYAHVVVLPNIYFHTVTAYGILRKEGVELGKRDYYAGFFPPQK